MRKPPLIASQVALRHGPPPPSDSPKPPAFEIARVAPVGAIGVLEALGLPPAWFGDLPLPATLRMRTRDDVSVVATTDRAAYEAARRAGVPVFTGGELGALAVAAENGRATAETLAVWLSERADNPALRLDAAVALGGVCDAETPSRRWPLGRVLRSYGLTLESVDVGGEDV